MQLYGMIKFYTGFSGRSMGEGSIIRYKKVYGFYELDKIILEDRALYLGLVSGDFLENYKIPVNYLKNYMSGEVNNDIKYALKTFEAENDESVLLMNELEGGIWNNV